jgi:hypothetical protein
MKALLDRTFPEYAVTELSTPDWEWDRVGPGELSDETIIEHAAREQFHAVIFLGRQALGRRDVRDTALLSDISIVVVTSTNPVDAVRHLRKNLHRLKDLLPSRRPIALASHFVELADWEV